MTRFRIALVAFALAQATLVPPARAESPVCETPDHMGCEAWIATYDDPADGMDTPINLNSGTQSLVLSPSGDRVYVTGSSWGGDPSAGGTQYDYVTIAYDQTGTTLWVARYAGPGGASDNAWSLGISPDGTRIFVTGASYVGAPGYWDFATVAYDAATGAQEWLQRFDAAPVDRAWSLAVSPDGNRVFVTGDSGQNYGTVAYDAATGAQAWVATYNGPASGFDRPRMVASSPDGTTVYVTGESSGGSVTGTDFATVAYDAATGAQRWLARFTGIGSGADSAYALDVSPDGSSVYATGPSASGNDYNYAVVAYVASTGGQRWASTYDGPGRSFDFPLSIAVAHDGARLFVTGYSAGVVSSYDYGTVAYASTGAELWAARYNGPAGANSDIAFGVAVSPDDDTVFVTGASPPLSESDNWDVATLGYAADTGGELWLARFDGSESFQDQAYAIAASPDGSRIYVSGETWHSTSPGYADYLTMAYDTGIDIAQPIIAAPTQGALLNDSLVQVAGTGPRGARVDIREAGSSVAEAIADAAGNWSVTASFADGDHTLEAVATFTSGQMSPPSAPRAFTVDTASPAAPVVTSPAEGQRLSASLVEVSGTAEAGSLVEIAEGAASLGQTQADQSGSWSLSLSFADGAHELAVTATDAAGNGSVPTSRSFSVDAHAPPAPIIVRPREGASLSDPHVAISGTAEPGAQVTVREDAIPLAVLAADPAGSWSVVHMFTDGEHEITATATDQSGNDGPPATRSFTVDTVAPDTPVIDTPGEGSELANSFVDLTGTAEPGVRVIVTEEGAIVGATIADASARWVAGVGFANGGHAVGVIGTDAAGNTSAPSPARTFSVSDSTPPAAPLIVEPAEGARLGSASVSAFGTSEPGSSISVRADGAQAGVAEANAAGNWRVILSLANGEHALSAVATDPAGNVGPATGLRRFTVAVDPYAGAPAIVVPPEGSLQPGAVTIAGTFGGPGARIGISEDGTALGSATVAPDGSWSLSVNLSSGEHVVTADAAGARSAPRSFTVDAAPPEVQVSTRDGTVFLPAAPARVEGRAGDNLGVAAVELRYYDARGRHALTQIAECAACGSGGIEVVWSSSPALNSGFYSVQVNAIDLAGNRSAVRGIRFVAI